MKNAFLTFAFAAALLSPLQAEPENRIVLTIEPTAQNPRNTEGAFMELKSGRIIFLYSQFYRGVSDFSHAHIAEIDSDDQGRTWSAPRVVIENGDNLNVMSVSLLRLQDGRLALFYAVKKNAFDCRPAMRVSTDEGATWSAPRPMIEPPGYFVLNNDRVIQTRTGRLIAPVALHRPLAATFRGPDSIDSHGIVLWYYSDDAGLTWKQSPTWWALPVVSTSGLQEPGVVELANGSLFSWSRTDVGCQYGFRSQDGGTTWSPPELTELKSPLSPASIKRLPHSSTLLALYDDHSGRFIYGPHRAPLVAALSTDGGRTWPRRRLLDDNAEHNGWYCYTATWYAGDTVLLAYWVYDAKMTPEYLKNGRPSRLRLRRVALSWFAGAQ